MREPERPPEDQAWEINLDFSFDTELEPEPQPPGLWQRSRGWLALLLVVVLLGGAFVFAGRTLYEPEARIPAPPGYPPVLGLYATNQAVQQQLEATAAPFQAASPGDLAVQGEILELAFPRTVADRLFAQRDEKARVYTFEDGEGAAIRVMRLYEDGEMRLTALEASAYRGAVGGRGGVFIVLPTASNHPYEALLAAVEFALDAAEGAAVSRFESGDYTIFGPFISGDGEALRARIEDNIVMAHLARELEAAGADVSVAAPALLLRPTPPRGFILGLYLPALHLVLEPVWGDSSTDTLAHELAHAYIHTVTPNRTEVLRDAAAYFEAVHPRLYGRVISELYASLGPEGRAEEAIAFIMGSIASGHTRTVAPVQVLDNQGFASVAEPIFATDIDLLVELNLLPACMAPAGLSFDEPQLNFRYYDLAREACDTAPSR